MSSLLFSVLIGFKTLLSMMLLSVVPIVVRTNEGERLEGNLIEIRDSNLKISVGSEERSFRFDAISSLDPVTAPSIGGPVLSVRLFNGTTVAAESVVSDGEKIEIVPRQQMPLKLPLSEVKAIRFRRGSTDTDAQWLGWLEQSQRSDLLVIRREGNRLDPQQGLITSLTKETVGFDLEGTPVDAPLDRLEGVVFADPSIMPAEPQISVLDQFGSQWRVADIRVDVEASLMTLDLGEGLEHSVPLAQLSAVRWSTGMIMLAGLPPVESNFKSLVGTKVEPALLNAFFAASSVDDQHLMMHSGSRVEYRVDEGFTKLVGSVARHPDSNPGGVVTVLIELDGKEIWNEAVPENQVTGFDIPLDNARRLVIRVDDGGDGEVGDTVQVNRPRLIK